MRIRFGELKIGGIARSYINRALTKNWVTEGENVREFEERFAAKFGYKHAIATSSGTDADTCCCASLYELGAKRGDEVILPALCFGSCANSIIAAGFLPRFVDIELETLNIDPLEIEKAIRPNKTRAILAVHTMGKPCEMDTISAIAEVYRLRWGLKVIEDCAEAHGAIYKGRVVGSLGDMGAFSFYAAHLIVCGEGGMVVTNNDQIADAVKSLKSHGRPPSTNYFDFQRVGFNSKMNDLEAAIGLEGLENFNKALKKRKENMRKLLELTEDLRDYCIFPTRENYEDVSPHAFWLILKKESGEYGCTKLYNYLQERGIECKTLFGSLPTQHRAFQYYIPIRRQRYHDMPYEWEFPVAEYVGRNGLHFGIHQYLTDDDLVYISETLRGYFRP